MHGVIIDSWDVHKYNFVIVFILSSYVIGSLMYIYFNYKRKSLKKVLIHFIIGAIIVLGISIAISSISYKTVHIIYQYNHESEVLYLVDRGWVLVEHNRLYGRAHFSKEYKNTKIRWFYPSNGGKNIEDYY